MSTSISSPNLIVWSYFSALRRIAARLCDCDDQEIVRQDAAMCLMLAVTCVEAFINAYFRIRASTGGSDSSLLKIVGERRSLDYKIRQWPRQFFGTPLDLRKEPCKAFMRLKRDRNDLVHFSSVGKSIEFEGVIIRGMADTSLYHGLDASTAGRCISVAENFIGEILRLESNDPNVIAQGIHLWTGMPPLVVGEDG